ncbi:uroporphyrinogen-III synthase [Lysobacter sp. SG-8]|uniref:Uroporphyrinogen-III synthase n=1 Tax=Marilutibacter penaei TaxID=2759900 RepID=A0A7W3U1P6_9GAMM|nr:uroporphyrinogen-III synthase [Lysobacter penaei]MBB1087274.1 uroporphyrinogen-III synthase [Lysobacter penaei]
MPSPPRTPWNIVSLRPAGRHGALRAAARRHGGGLIALSSCRIEPVCDVTAQASLEAALGAAVVIFTSPEAVRAARARVSGSTIDSAVAVGSGTAAALRRLGIRGVISPARMDSEGLLDLPILQTVAGHAVGLVTAPGGRGRLQPALEARGARVVRADIYRRVPHAPSPRAVAALLEATAPGVVAVSSAEALQHVLQVLPAPAGERLRGMAAVAASKRLAETARAAGFEHIRVANGPRPAQLVAAVRTHPAR